MNRYQSLHCPRGVGQGNLRHLHCPRSPDPHHPQGQPVSRGQAIVPHPIGQLALQQDARNKWDVVGAESDRDREREDAV